jgi:hypothetical protein
MEVPFNHKKYGITQNICIRSEEWIPGDFEINSQIDYFILSVYKSSAAINTFS